MICKTITYFIVSFLTLLVALPGFAQGKYTLYGRVVDQETGSPITHASLGVPQKRAGTTTDAAGYFILNFPNVSEVDQLVVSCIGYASVTMPLVGLSLEDTTVIELNPAQALKSGALPNSNVEAMSGKDLVAKSIKRLNKLFNGKTYLMGGMYREQIYLGQACLGLTDAFGYSFVGAYNRAYNSIRNKNYTYDLIQWKQVRRSRYESGWQMNKVLPRYLLVNRLLRVKDFYTYKGPVSSAGLKMYQYKVTGATSYNGTLVYSMQFEPANPGETPGLRGQLMISASDYAPLRVEVVAKRLPAIKGRDMIDASGLIESRYTIQYSALAGRYYLNRVQLHNQYLPSQEGDTLQVLLELNAGNYTINPQAELNTEQRYILYSEMLNPLVYYEPDFWQNIRLERHRCTADMAQFEPEFEALHQKRLVPLPGQYTNYQDMYYNHVALDAYFRDY